MSKRNTLREGHFRTRLATRRAHQQVRTDVTEAIKSSLQQPRIAVRQINKGTIPFNLRMGSECWFNEWESRWDSGILERRKVDIFCIQESMWKVDSARIIDDKSYRYNVHYCVNDSGYGGVEMLFAEKFADNLL